MSTRATRVLGLAVVSAALACSPAEPQAPARPNAESDLRPDSGNSEPEQGGPAEGCSAIPFAPAPLSFDGRDAVPIDILELDAALRFDVAAASAEAHARLRFRLGPAGGMPIFDLRQTPTTLTLDGQARSTELLARREFGRGLDAGFVVLELALEPCSEHTLELAYPLAQPDAPGASAIEFRQDPAELRLALDSSDLDPGRYLEAWLPANMPWDRHPITLTIEVIGAETETLLISNAEVDTRGPAAWQLAFPPTSTAMDPLIELLPRARVTTEFGVHQTLAGHSIPYRVHVDLDVSTPIAEIVGRITTALDTLEARLGPYPHPTLTVHVRAGGRSMEYAGAMVTSLAALEHELVHAWWARGLSPATYADGWIDEGWATYTTAGPEARTAIALDPTAGPWRIYDAHPFARVTPKIAYNGGRQVFAGLAAILGVEELDAAMAELHAELGPLGSLTTAQLEHHLHCVSGEQLEVRQVLHRYVYGFEGEAEPLPAGTCGP